MQVDRNEFYSTLRMTPEVFDELLGILRPTIEKQDTTYRLAIPPDVRLSVCLRHLTIST